MALATETDPVETLRLILDTDEPHTGAGDYSNLGSAPDHVEKSWETDRQTKINRAVNVGSTAIYVWSPEVGTFPQFDAAWDYEDLQVVQAECWCPDSADAGLLAEDVRNILFASWVRDNKQNSVWNSIRPTQENDARASTPAEPSGKVYQVDVQVALGRLVDT